MIAPLAPVTFWHVIVADYLTSLAKAFSDLQVSDGWATTRLHSRVPARYVPARCVLLTHIATERRRSTACHASSSLASAVAP